MENRYFHYSIGPVQSFVSQARRTRDFWGGSFLLSWLSAVSMRAVIAADGEIVFPQTQEDLLASLETGVDGPIQGSVPNRFLAKIPADFEAGRIRESLDKAWEGLCQLIWEGDLKGIADAGTRKVWERQTEGFWEVNWALSEEREDSTLLKRRKGIRNHYPPAEPGDKCSIMEGWQELSGSSKPGKQVMEFWDGLKSSIAQPFDLRDGEKLCSIAYVKRRFARYFSKLRVDMPGGWTLKGWDLPTGVPSTSHVAASAWLSEALPEMSEDTLNTILKCADRLRVGFSENTARLPGLGRILESKLQGKVASLDAKIFFRDIGTDDYGDESYLRDEIFAVLPKAPRGPHPFYSIVLLDGDRLGKSMGDAGNQEYISKALQDFVQTVPEIVEDELGFLIYAGGDDVLSLHPVGHGIRCARKLRKAYEAAFAQGRVDTSASAAVNIVHIKKPLTAALQNAHLLLDGTAKEERGRNTLAIMVEKQSGEVLKWAMPWEFAMSDEGDNLMLEHLVQAQRENSILSTGFIYKIRSILSGQQDGEEQGFDWETSRRLMAAELLASGTTTGLKIGIDDAIRFVEPMLEQCRYASRREYGVPPEYSETRISPDAALLVRFLAEKEVV